jgi:DNA mismatch repair protein MutL
VVRGLPQFMGKTEAHEVVKDILTGNESHEGCSPPDREFQPYDLPIRERLLALTACRGAIKAHQSLSLKEMEDLLDDLLSCEVPLHCAHGRPTMIRLPLSVLERWFKRVL